MYDEVNHVYAITIYGIYVVVAACLVVYLTRVLGKNGSIFLKNIFPDEPGMATAVNNLLVTGFFMLNLGFAFMIIETSEPTSLEELMVILFKKLGTLILCLGIVHLINVTVFYKVRRSHEIQKTFPLPPIAPAGEYQQGEKLMPPPPWK